MPADRPNPSARYEALFKGCFLYCCRFETETVALLLPDVDRNIAAPTRQLFLAAHAKAKRAAVVWILEQAMRLLNLVSDGTKAVQAIIRWTYDAALTGIRLRNIDGADTTAAIRDLPSEHKLTTSYAFVGALKLSNAVNISCFRPEWRDGRCHIPARRPV